MSGSRPQPQFSYDPGPFEFRPPRNNPLVTWLAHKFAPHYLNSVGVTKLDVSDRDLARLQAHQNSRAILVSNHPSFEPVVLFHLTGLVSKEINIMSARELFNKSWLHNLILPLLGAYSVNRGVNDTQSFKQTRNIITEGKRWLVVFPGGQDHYMSDLLMPFQPGIVRLAFWALDALKDDGPPPVHCIPIAIRYHFTEDMSAEINASLDRLESSLNLYAAGDATTPYDRLLRIAQRLIEDNEGYYKIPPDVTIPLQERIDRLRNLVIERVANGMGIEVPPEDLPLRDRIRTLLNALDMIRPPDIEERSDYVKNLVARGESYAAELHAELYRVLTFVGVSGSYVATRPTAERFCDVLSRLEYEITGEERNFGPKCAKVLVGQPLDLAEHYNEYVANRREVPEQINRQLEDQVSALLESSKDLMTPFDAGSGQAPQGETR